MPTVNISNAANEFGFFDRGTTDLSNWFKGMGIDPNSWLGPEGVPEGSRLPTEGHPGDWAGEAEDLSTRKKTPFTNKNVMYAALGLGILLIVMGGRRR